MSEVRPERPAFAVGSRHRNREVRILAVKARMLQIEGTGIEVVTIPYDELHKNGGGVHCSTIELVRDPA